MLACIYHALAELLSAGFTGWLAQIGIRGAFFVKLRLSGTGAVGSSGGSGQACSYQVGFRWLRDVLLSVETLWAKACYITLGRMHDDVWPTAVGYAFLACALVCEYMFEF